MEFGVLFVLAPVLLAVALPPQHLPVAFLVLFGASVLLLAATPGFSWASLWQGWGDLNWRFLAGATLLAGMVVYMLVALLVPAQAFFLPQRLPGLWITIVIAYPFLSAIPQEVMFRALFFSRYGELFPSRALAVAVNGAVFGLAHLAFWNSLAVGLSAAGGVLFAEAYLRRGGFPASCILHAICGILVFTLGLGTFFYHGAIPAR